MRLQAEYPIPPSTNHLYATVRGRRILTSVGRSYKQAAKLKTMAEWGRKPKLVAPLTMTMTVFSPIWHTKMGREKGVDECIKNGKTPYRRMDVSNRIKILEDAICEVICYWGDEQVWYLVVKKQESKREWVQVFVEQLGTTFP